MKNRTEIQYTYKVIVILSQKKISIFTDIREAQEL